ncbi:MAG TPA: acetyl-CoA carboxylase biotin carboxylase subunit [Gemmatimonadales bacterium]|nr:acetyl-CoA carboxylase biotin carboxylase subunit [Gemmatimonadales bacterium]
MHRVLVANRGEIALRIIRGCHEEGLEAVAVYSDIDRDARHVRAADFAVHIGGSPPSESYLRIDRIIDAAKQSGADAIHPGYGFLSERAEFAEAVMASGLTFIGPPPGAIAAMGDKTAARRRMREAGVPVVPGSVEPLDSAAAAAKAARTIGYPILLKAAAGGGGRGMRVIRTEEEIQNAFVAAQSEAFAAFGDQRIYLERYLEGPRHIEIQILADAHGRVIALGERECSVQRRHQKLIEEAPSVAVRPAVRRAMGEAAVRAAQAVRYVSAGTVEFLMLPNGDFYFLEMNTRLQVEHPVTELVYGVDLVRMQLKIAMGHHLSLPERALEPRGWAIECRITAEDPFADFMPAGGVISGLRLPEGPGVRWDGWIEQGSEVPLHYDSLLGKLVVWGESRERAIKRMRRALNELVICGVPTSREFHQRAMHEPSFVAGSIDIGYWDRVGKALMGRGPDQQLVQDAAVAAALLEHEQRGSGKPSGQLNDSASVDRGRGSAWREAARREGLRP